MDPLTNLDPQAAWEVPTLVTLLSAILARWLGPDAMRVLRVASSKLNGGHNPPVQNETATDILKEIRSISKAQVELSEAMLAKMQDVQNTLEVMDRVAERRGPR